MTVARNKYVSEFWHKYEAIGNLDAEFPPSREQFFSFFESAYRAWVNSGNASAQIEADVEHHIAVQSVFRKWREVHGERI